MLLRTIVLYGGFVVVPFALALQRSNVSSSPLSTSSFTCSSVYFVFAFSQDSHCHPYTPWIASPSCTINSRLRELLPEMPPSISPIIVHYIKAQGTESPTLLSDRKHHKPVCTFSLSSYPPSIFIRPPAQHRSLQ